VEPPRKYLPLFVAEATEQLEELSRELVRLEAEPPGGPLWDSIFRRAHSVKGSAATLALAGIVRIAHAAETLVGRLKSRPVRPSRPEIDLLLEAADALLSRVRAAARSQRLDEPGDAALVERLTEAARAIEPPPAAPVAFAADADSGLPRLKIAIELSPRCAAPSARALIVQRRLRSLGSLLDMQPAPQQLQAGQGLVRLTATIATKATVDEVRASIRGVPEVDAVYIETPALEKPASFPPVLPEADRALTVRVRADSLDQLLDGAGEMLLGIARLRDSARKLPETFSAAFEGEIDRLRRQARELHGRVMTARLTPFSALTERLPRAVRDLGHQLGKQVDIEIQGTDVELDRAAIETLSDPLVHIVRNAVDHGIESPETRAAAGKPARGRVLLAARRERDSVVVEIEDDGRGLDAPGLRERAVRAGALTAEAAAALDDSRSYELALLPGISTKSEATDVSGRGVGMDAVQRAVEGLGGAIRLHSSPGRGTRVTLKLPLLVSVAQLLLVQVGGEVFGLPLYKVLLTTEYDLSARGGEGFESRSLVVGGQLVRAYSLAKLFGLPSLAPPGPRPFLVMELDGVRFALSVDRLLGQEEAVMKPLFPPLDRIQGLAAVTVLGNGRPLLVLDPRGLYQMAGAPEGKIKGAA